LSFSFYGAGLSSLLADTSVRQIKRAINEVWYKTAVDQYATEPDSLVSKCHLMLPQAASPW